MHFRMRVVFFMVFLLGSPLSAMLWAYSGGDGTSSDPYKIASVADLMQLGATPADYDKHFLLVSDIDLDPNGPNGRVFTQALIAPIRDINDIGLDIPFTGHFDGGGHVLRNLVFTGDHHLGLFGALNTQALVSRLGLEGVRVTTQEGPSGGLAALSWGRIEECFVTGLLSGQGVDVGGLVGSQQGGHVSSCYSEGAISGTARLGGLVGSLVTGSMSDCYSWSHVQGRDTAGGLVGHVEQGDLFHCYSVGAVQADRLAGGLIGENRAGLAIGCFWDRETSGQLTSDGGTAADTAEMRDLRLYLDSGWDFIDEETNGTADRWQRVVGDTTPRLANVAVSLPDATLKLMVEAELDKRNPTRRDMLSLKNLSVIHGDVTRLEGLEVAIHLEHLDLRNNRITSVVPLTGLHELATLGLSENRIADITPLAGLTGLVELGLGANLLQDTRPLRDLTKLTLLSLYDNEIADIAALGSLAELEILWLEDNAVNDIQPLLGIDSLAWVELRGNRLDSSHCADLALLKKQIDRNHGRLFHDHFPCP